MKKLLSLFALTACLVLANFLPAAAQPVKIWSSSELWETADLVVIATVADIQPPQTTKESWEPIETLFDIHVVLKGKLEKNSVSVWHGQWRDRNPQIEAFNGVSALEPSYVKFNQKEKNQYLIFLKFKPEESCQPLTGPFNDAGSFLRLEPYDASKEQPAQQKTPKK